MELDSHAMDRDTSLLHTLDHVDSSLVLARAVRWTVVIVEEECVRVGFGSPAEGVVNMCHVISSGGIPGPDGLQERIAFMTVGDRLVDNIPSIDIVSSIFGQGFDISHGPLNVLLEFTVKGCLISLPL